MLRVKRLLLRLKSWGERDKRLMLSIRRKSSSDNHQAGSEPMNLSRAISLLFATKQNALERQQLQLTRYPTCIATHRAARADNAMTRHENRNGIAPYRRCHRTNRRRRASRSRSHASSQRAIGQGLSERYRQQFAPHRHLKIRAAPFHIRQRRQRQSARKIGRQPPTSRLDKRRKSIKHSRLIGNVHTRR